MTDEALMAAYRGGDFHAFQTLYEKHRGRVMGYLVLKLRDRNDAEDAFQTVFSKLHAGRSTYKDEIPFLPWLFTITRNVVIDHVRKKDTAKKYFHVSTEFLSHCADENKTASEPIGSVIPELASLTESQRQVLEMRFNDGLSFEDISQHMDITRSNARQIASRAVKALRKLFRGKGLDQ
jgi:RNA polymerase sigma-70 factor (ECF subfamily)